MPDLTPEQEQERLRLIQQQNEAANELLSTYEKLSTSVEQLKNDEKELVSLSKQLVESSIKIEGSLEKRSETLTSIVNLSKSLNKETSDYNKSLTESVKLKDKLSATTAVKPVVKAPTLPETTTQTVTPNINVEVPELTVTPKLKLADVPELIITPNLVLSATPQLTIVPNLVVAPVPTQSVTPNLAVEAAPLQTVIPNIQVLPAPQQTITPDVVLGATPQLLVTPNIALADIQPQVVTPNIQLLPTPVQTVTPNLILAATPQLTVTPNIIVTEPKQQTVTPNLVLASPLVPLTITPNLVLGPVSQLTVTPNLVVESTPVTVTPNFQVLPAEQQTVVPNIQVLQAPLQTITPNLAVEAAPQLVVTPNLVLGPVPQLSVVPNFITGPVPQLLVNPNLALDDAPVQTVVPNLVLGPIPQLTVAPNLVLDASPQLAVTPNFVVAPAPQQTVIPNLTVAPVPQLTVTPNITLADVPAQTVTPNLTLGPSSPLAVIPNFIVGPTPQLLVNPNLALADAPVQTVVPNLILGPVPQLTITPNLVAEATPQLSVIPNIVAADAPAQIVTPNFILGPIPQLTVTPNLVAEATPLVVTPNITVTDAPQQTVTPNLVVGPVPQLPVIPNLSLGITPQLMVTPNLALEPSPVQTVLPNLVLGPIPQLTVVPNLVAEVSPINVTPNFVVADTPAQTVTPNFVVGPVPQINVTPNLAVNAAPQLTVTPNIAVAEAPAQTVVPNLVLGPIPQLTITPNLVADANPISVTPNFVVTDAPQQTVTPNLVVADPLAPLSVTPNLQLAPSPVQLVTPNLQLSTLSPLTITPEIQVQTPVLTVTPEVNVVNPKVTAEAGGNAGGSVAASPFPFDKKQLSDIVKEGFEHALKKYERSPSLGVTLDKDKSGLLTKLASAATLIYSEIKKQLGLTPPEVKPETPSPAVSTVVPAGGNTGVGVMNTGTVSNVSQTQTPATPTATTPTASPLPPNLTQLITAASDEAKNLQEEIIRINERIIAAGGAGINLQQAFRAADDDTDKLNTLLGQANRNLSSLTDNAEYIYRTFQDISDEQTRQNTLLKLGKSAFSSYTDIAQNLNSYQKGYNELTDKQFKKYQQNIQAQKDELKYIVEKLGKTQQQRLATIAVLSAQSDLSKSQKARLKELENEEALLNNAGMAIESGIPILERELNLTKQISDTRSSLGGITKAAGEVISKFGGSLAKYLNISDATEAANEYNKNLVKAALENEGVQNKLLGIEEKRVEKEKELYEAVKAINANTSLDANQRALAIKEKEKQYTKDILALDEESNSVKQKAIKSVDTFGNKFKSLGVFAKEAGSGLLKAFTDPVVVLTTLIELGFKADKQITELGKSFGLSKDSTRAMRADMTAFARSTGDTFINTDRLMKAQAELSQEMGMAVKFSNEELSTFAKLTELTGLSAQEAGKLAGNAAAAGMSTEVYTDSIREGAFSAMQATKTHFSQKDVMQDIAKLSAGTLAKFQGNPKALAAAVVEAKKLGTNLGQIDKIGESLLDFQSSLENELKAELMTGKQLNLERARAAALSGDQLALTREISSQVGTSADFNKMNVLAQKSLAEAFGMSRDEMADMLMKQEAVNKYGKEAATLNKEQLEDMKRQGLSAAEYLQQQEQQRDAQSKFQDAMTKLQSIIANLVDGPVGQLLDALANMVGFVMKIFGNPVVKGFFDIIAFTAQKLADMVSTTPGLITAFSVLGLVLLPKIVGGIGGMFSSVTSGIKGIKNSATDLGSNIKNVFSKEGRAKLKEKFAGGGDKAKDAAEKGAEGAEKTSESTNKSESGSDGSKFKTKMQNIADGIKAFADKDVLKGALALIPASIGLVLFIPGALGAKVVEIVNGEKFQSAMEGIANGISAFGENVTLGAIGKLALGGVALDLFALGTPGMLLLQLVNGDKFQSAMEGIGAGISSFGENATIGAIAKLALGGLALDLFALGVPGMLLLQLVNGTLIEKTLGGIGKGIAAFSQSVSWGELIKAAVAIALLGASLIPAAYAFKQFAEVSWEDMAKAGVTLIGLGIAGSILGGMAGELLMGALAIAALGASLIPAAFAFQMFAKVKWSDMAKAGVALLGLGVAGFIFGTLSPIMFIGALAIAALGAALIPFAIALNIMTPAIEKFGIAFKTALDGVADIVTAVGNAIKAGFEGIASVVTAVGDSVTEIITAVNKADIGKMMAMGPALISLAAGLAALGGGGLVKSATGFISGAVDSIGNLIGVTDEADTGGPITLLNNIAASAENIFKASEGLKSFTDTIERLNSINVSNLASLPPLLKSIGDSMISLGTGSILAGIGGMLGGGPVEMLKGIGEAGDGVEKTASAVKNLTSIDVNSLLALAPALKSVGDSMLYFAASSLLLSIGGGPVEILNAISNSGAGIQKSASALQMMASALLQVSSALDKIDISKLNAVKESNVGNAAAPKTGGGLGDYLHALFNPLDTLEGLVSGEVPGITGESQPITTSSVIPTKETGEMGVGGIDLSPMITAINEVKSAVDKLYGKNQSIYMDAQVVGGIIGNQSDTGTKQSQGSRKVV
jgi:hypothetical protein